VQSFTDGNSLLWTFCSGDICVISACSTDQMWSRLYSRFKNQVIPLTWLITLTIIQHHHADYGYCCLQLFITGPFNVESLYYYTSEYSVVSRQYSKWSLVQWVYLKGR